MALAGMGAPVRPQVAGQLASDLGEPGIVCGAGVGDEAEPVPLPDHVDVVGELDVVGGVLGPGRCPPTAPGAAGPPVLGVDEDRALHRPPPDEPAGEIPGACAFVEVRLPRHRHVLAQVTGLQPVGQVPAERQRRGDVRFAADRILPRAGTVRFPKVRRAVTSVVAGEGHLRPLMTAVPRWPDTSSSAHRCRAGRDALPGLGRQQRRVGHRDLAANDPFVCDELGSARPMTPAPSCYSGSSPPPTHPPASARTGH